MYSKAGSVKVNTDNQGRTWATLWSCSLLLAELQALKVSWLLAEALPCGCQHTRSLYSDTMYNKEVL